MLCIKSNIVMHKKDLNNGIVTNYAHIYNGKTKEIFGKC
jgi:hypothetical protein